MEKKLRRQLQLTESAIESADSQLRDLYREIGLLVVQNQADADASLTPLLDRYTGIQSEIARNADEIELIAKIETRRLEITDRQKLIRTKQQEIIAEIQPVYEEIGQTGFTLFREHPLIDAGYSAIFQKLAQYYDEISRISSQQDQVRSGIESSNIFGKAVLQGKKLLLHSQKTGKQSRLPTLLIEAGQRLVATGFIAQIDDPKLNEVSEPLVVAQKRIAELDDEFETLSEETGRLDSEMEELTKGKRIAKAKQERETAISNLQSTLVEHVQEIGKIASGTADPLFETERTRVIGKQEVMTRR